MATKNTVTVEVNIVEKGNLKKIILQGKEAKRYLADLNKETKKGTSAGEAYRKAQGSIADGSRNATKNFAKQAQGLGGLVRAYAATAANIWAVTAAFSALKNAADLKILETSMQTLDRAHGTNLFGMARALKEVAGGMITFEAAATRATTVAAAGFGRKELIGLGKAAKAASQALGRDFSESLDRMVRGVIKAEPELLDELGIILRLDDASRKYAKTLGKSHTELTTFEKQIAVMNEVLSQAEEKYGALADKQEVVNQFSRLGAASTETITQGMLALGGALGPLAGFFAENQKALMSMLGIFSFFILKSALPGLSTLGTKLGSFSKKADIAAERLAGIVSGQKRNLINFNKSLTQSSDVAHIAFRRMMNSSVLAGRLTENMKKKMTSGLTGQAFAKDLTRNLNIAFKTAFASIDPSTGLATKGFFKGMAKVEIEGFQSIHKRATSSITTMHRTMYKRMGTGAAFFFNNAKLRLTTFAQDSAVAAQKVGTGWSRTGQLINERGFFGGIKAANKEAKSFETGILGASRGAFRLGVGLKAVGSIASSAFSTLMPLFLAYQVGSALFEAFFESDKSKAATKALKELKGGYEAVDSSARLFVDTLTAIQSTSHSTTKDAIEGAKLLKNAYQQVADEIGSAFQRASTVISVELDKVESKMAARARDRSKLAAQGFKSQNLASTGGYAQLANLPAADAGASIVDPNLSTEVVKSVQRVFDKFSSVTKIFERDVLSTNTELSAYFKDLMEDSKLSEEAYRALAAAFEDTSTKIALRTRAFHESLKSVQATAASTSSDIVGAIVPGADKVDKVFNKIKDTLTSVGVGLEGYSNFETGEKKLQDLVIVWNELETISARLEGRDIEIMTFSKARLADGFLSVLNAKLLDTENAADKAVKKLSDPIFSKLKGFTSKFILDEDLTQLTETLRIAKAAGKSAQQTKDVRSARFALLNAETSNMERSAGFAKRALELEKQATGSAYIKFDLSQRQLDIEEKLVKDIFAKEREVLGQITFEERVALALAEARALAEVDNKRLIGEEVERLRVLNQVAETLNANRKQAAVIEELATSNRLISLDREQKLLEAKHRVTSDFFTQRSYQEQFVLDLKRAELEYTKKQTSAQEALNSATATSLLLRLNAVDDKGNKTGRVSDAQITDADTAIVSANNALRQVDAVYEIKLSEMTDKYEQGLLDVPFTMAEGFNQAMLKMSSDVRSWGSVIEEVTTNSIGSFVDGLVDLGIQGDLTASSFGNMAADIILEIGTMIAKQLLFNSIAAMFGGPASAISMFGAKVPNLSIPLPTSIGGSDVGRFATGGVVNKPTVSLFGEAGAEAFVPLPDGRTIPVTMSGDTSNATNNITVNVSMSGNGVETTANTTESQQSQSQIGQAIASAVQAELFKQSRPGGILNRGRR